MRLCGKPCPQKGAGLFLLCFALALAFLVAGMAGCARHRTEAPKPKKVTIAFQEWVGYGLFYLAQEKGFCRDEGIELVFIDEQLDSARRDAFRLKMLDCEAGTIDLLVSKRARGVPLVAVMELDRSYGADGIVATRDIRTVGDLTGKRVAMARDDVGETFVSHVLHRAGLSLDKVTTVLEAPDRVGEAFLREGADAAATWEPQLSRALGRPGAHVLVSTRDEPGIIIDTLNVREDIVRADPKLVRGLMRAWFRALEYYREHPVEARAIIAPHFNYTPEQYGKAVEGLTWTTYAGQTASNEAGSRIDAFNEVAAVKLLNKRISAKPDAASGFNDALLKGLYEDSR